VHITALAAVPEDLLVTLEHLVAHNVLKQLPVTILMRFLGSRDGLEAGSDLFKSLLLGHFGKHRIEFSPLLMLTLSSSLKVIFGG